MDQRCARGFRVCWLWAPAHSWVPVAIQVIELTMKRLKELNQPFKYIVTCAIMQKNGAGLHMATSTFWDNSSDGEIHSTWRHAAKPPLQAKLAASHLPSQGAQRSSGTVRQCTA